MQHIISNIFIHFSWSEPDCETLMVDPQANVYLISKVSDGRGALYYLPNSAWGTGHRVHVDSAADVSAPSTHKDPVGGDISPDGNGVLVKVPYFTRSIITDKPELSAILCESFYE